VAIGGPEPDEHDYWACTDEDCPAELCRIYKDGRRNGHDAGYDAGYTAGEAEGYVTRYGEGHKDGSR
jgi:hypothetical protein